MDVTYMLNILLSEEAFSVSNVVFYQTKSDMQIK